MPEYCDIYDIDRNKTGRLHERGKPDMKEGDCLLVVFVWITNSDDEFLISKRVEGIWRGGMWQTTGGIAIAGDNSLSAALRETKEELGITLAQENGRLVKKYSEGANLFDVWLFHQEVDISDVVLQPEETCAVMWASREKIEQLSDEGNFISGEPPQTRR